MTKKLKELAELYKPKAKGEENFVKKHVVVKHKDRNGNGDDVFNASKIKSVDKSPEHGYNAGEDEAVYEEILDELSRETLINYRTKAVGKLNPVAAKKRKADTQTTNRIRSGKSLKDYKPKDALSDEEKRVHKNRSRGESRARGRINHLDGIMDGKKKSSYKDYVKEEVITELSSAAIKRYKGAALDNLNYHSKQWDRLAKLHSFTLGQEKAFDKHDQTSERRYKGLKLAKDKLGEEVEDLYELSKKTLARYVTKAAGSLGQKMAAAAHTASKDGKRHMLKIAGRRRVGIDRAAYKLAEDVQLDELSKLTLGRYVKASSAAAVNKALFDLPATHHMDGDRATKKKARENVWRKINNREKGVNRATSKLVKEDELQELNRNGALTRYIAKTTDDPKRKVGRALAQKKRWGDEKYGLPEPKVKAVTRESVEQIDELSKKTLTSYLNKAGRSKSWNRSDDEDHDPRITKKKLKHVHLAKNPNTSWDSAGGSGKKSKEFAAKTRYYKKLAADKIAGPKIRVYASEEVEQIDELSKKTLASYINKAAVKNLAHAGSLATQAHDEDKDKRDEAGKTAKKLVNKLDGIHRATKRLAKD